MHRNTPSPLILPGLILAVSLALPACAQDSPRAASPAPTIGVYTLTEASPRLSAASAHLLLLVDAYHEFSHPREVMTGIVQGLKTGGRVVLIEYRGEDPVVPILALHKMTQAQARREMEAVGLEWVESRDVLPQQHFRVFRKP